MTTNFFRIDDPSGDFSHFAFSTQGHIIAVKVYHSKPGFMFKAWPDTTVIELTRHLPGDWIPLKDSDHDFGFLWMMIDRLGSGIITACNEVHSEWDAHEAKDSPTVEPRPQVPVLVTPVVLATPAELPPDPTDAPPFAKGAPVILTNQLYAGLQGEVVECTWSGGNAYRNGPHWLVKVQVQGTKHPAHQVVFYDNEMIPKRQRGARTGGTS